VGPRRHTHSSWRQRGPPTGARVPARGRMRFQGSSELGFPLGGLGETKLAPKGSGETEPAPLGSGEVKPVPKGSDEMEPMPMGSGEAEPML
jgi:hypothetical protein